MASLVFHLTVNPVRHNAGDPDNNREEEGGERECLTGPTAAPPPPASPAVAPMNVKDWLKEPQFYQVAGVYMSTRLFVNLTQAYIPLYLQVG